LVPRVSDCDFPAGALAIEDEPTDATPTLASIQELLDDQAGLVDPLVDFVEKNKPSQPIFAHQGAGVALNHTMLALLQQINKEGGSLPNEKAAARCLVDACLGCVESSIPEAWDGVGKILDLADEHGCIHQLQATSYGKLLETKVIYYTLNPKP
jgi:hypothetical protein